MEFTANVHGKSYSFSFLNNNSVLVSSRQGEYILYKDRTWRCADDLPPEIVEELGDVIDEHSNVSRP